MRTVPHVLAHFPFDALKATAFGPIGATDPCVLTFRFMTDQVTPGHHYLAAPVSVSEKTTFVKWTVISLKMHLSTVQ